MGLDMFARTVCASEDLPDVCSKLPPGLEAEEIFYWRKHAYLHGWMYKLAAEKGFDSGDSEFNLVYVRLTNEDLDRLQLDIENRKLPETHGFFFGNYPPDDESDKNDKQFIEKARKAIEDGLAVYYYSWW